MIIYWLLQTRVYAQKSVTDLSTSEVRKLPVIVNTCHFTFMTLDKSAVRKVVPQSYLEGLLYLIGVKHLQESRQREGL